MFDNKSPRLIIKEERHIKDLDDLISDDKSLSTLIEKLVFLKASNSNLIIVKPYYDRVMLYEIIERQENDHEYGKRIAKEKGEYEKYLKLKAKFEKE